MQLWGYMLPQREREREIKLLRCTSVQVSYGTMMCMFRYLQFELLWSKIRKNVFNLIPTGGRYFGNEICAKLNSGIVELCEHLLYQISIIWTGVERTCCTDFRTSYVVFQLHNSQHANNFYIKIQHEYSFVMWA